LEILHYLPTTDDMRIYQAKAGAKPAGPSI
jgi:hypothetical protein